MLGSEFTADSDPCRDSSGRFLRLGHASSFAESTGRVPQHWGLPLGEPRCRELKLRPSSRPTIPTQTGRLTCHTDRISSDGLLCGVGLPRRRHRMRKQDPLRCTGGGDRSAFAACKNSLIPSSPSSFVVSEHSLPISVRSAVPDLSPFRTADERS